MHLFKQTDDPDPTPPASRGRAFRIMPADVVATARDEAEFHERKRARHLETAERFRRQAANHDEMAAWEAEAARLAWRLVEIGGRAA